MGSTPLIAAVKSSQIELVQELLRAGARPDLRDRDGLDATSWAKRSGNQQIFDLLSAVYRPDSTTLLSEELLAAAKNGQLSKVNALLRKGANPDCRDSIEQENMTPLMIAATNADLSIVATLLKNGADVNARSPAGYTA